MYYAGSVRYKYICNKHFGNTHLNVSTQLRAECQTTTVDLFKDSW